LKVTTRIKQIKLEPFLQRPIPGIVWLHSLVTQVLTLNLIMLLAPKEVVLLALGVVEAVQ